MTWRLPHPLVIAAVAALTLTACGGSDDRPTTPTPPADESRDEPRRGTPIRVTFGDTELRGRLADNATARDLADQLPVMVRVRDHNSAEKTAPLPRELSIDGAPAGHDPAARDIGYWAPDGDLVFYYDDAAPYFDGIVRIGELEGDLGALERQSDGTAVTVARATQE